MSDKSTTNPLKPTSNEVAHASSAQQTYEGEEIEVIVTTGSDLCAAHPVSTLLVNSSHESGAIVIRRNQQFLEEVITTGHAVIARVVATREVIGFGYIETWSEAAVVTHGGVVVHPQWRLRTSQAYYPGKDVVSLTVHPAIMKINSQLGYHPERFEHLTPDNRFWGRCSSCSYHDTLERFQRRQCFCLGMVARAVVANNERG
jgi:hypothetical protein